MGKVLLWALIAITVAGCGGDAAPRPHPVASRAAGPCRPTVPDGDVPAAAKGFNHGNGDLAVALWPRGRLVAGRLPDGSSYADVLPDGSIEAKLGWWRGVEGRLSIEGERLDAASPPLRADVPEGYGPSGFQATAVTFPSERCWKVVGTVGRARLAFVVRVRASDPSRG
jgi:hypothetical protein